MERAMGQLTVKERDRTGDPRFVSAPPPKAQPFADPEAPAPAPPRGSGA